MEFYCCRTVAMKTNHTFLHLSSLPDSVHWLFLTWYSMYQLPSIKQMKNSSKAPSAWGLCYSAVDRANTHSISKSASYWYTWDSNRGRPKYTGPCQQYGRPRCNSRATGLSLTQPQLLLPFGELLSREGLSPYHSLFFTGTLPFK